MLAASILWKLSEYEDFVLPLLQADVAGVCAAVVEDLGSPRAGPLQFWLQVSVQVVCLGTRVYVLYEPYLARAVDSQFTWLGTRFLTVGVASVVVYYRKIRVIRLGAVNSSFFVLRWRGLDVDLVVWHPLSLWKSVLLADSSGRRSVPRGVHREREGGGAVESGQRPYHRGGSSMGASRGAS